MSAKESMPLLDRMLQFTRLGVSGGQEAYAKATGAAKSLLGLIEGKVLEAVL
jgi:hypothetical protein